MSSPFYPAARTAAWVSLYVRKKIFALFMRQFAGARRIVDVGVTSEEQSPDANFLERMYPHKERITAVGIEDASFLEKTYPGMKFVQVRPGERLPFPDRHFDLAFAHAVVEHIVDDAARRQFVAELVRVSNAVFMTTPNRRFPVETHTYVPLVHAVSTRWFNRLLDLRGGFYSRDNLRLLDHADLRALTRHFPDMRWRIRGVRLLGFTSNWIAVGTR